VRAGRDACPCRDLFDLFGCRFNASRAGRRSDPPQRGIHQRGPLMELACVKRLAVHPMAVHELVVDTRGRAQRPSPTRNSSTGTSSSRGMRSLRQLAKVINTKHIVVMPGDQPATTRVIAKRYRCTKITGFDATAKKHGHVGQCTIR